MSARRFSRELKQAFLWASLVAGRRHDDEVSIATLVSALMYTSEMQERLNTRGVSVDEICRSLTGVALSGVAAAITIECRQQGFEFGSQEHLGQIQPVPMNGRIEQALRELSMHDSGAERSVVSSQEVLARLLELDRGTAEVLARHGLNLDGGRDV